MNHKSNNIDEQIAECKENWFVDHKAKVVTATPEVTIIHWANPASWNYGCHFLIHKRWLIVVGDIGEATYEWSSDLTLQFLSGIDFGYFKSKCQSSEVGRNFIDWNEYVAGKNCEEAINAIITTKEEDRSEDDLLKLEILKEMSPGHVKQDYKEAAQEYYNKAGDGAGASEISEMGQVAHPRCIGHFTGLQMAIKQLSK